ncbi:hypothetical protein EOM60_03710 [Candidatus Saccharibacteria bacterium]|nr:hypothetical protein [Candidatus Saccharibacteria bacterium]
MAEVILRNKEEFRRLLDNYRISEESSAKLQKVRMAVFSGLVASGRNTIINKLIETGLYHFLISDTTRPPKLRDGKMEQDGVNYHFVTEEQFLDNLKNGRVIEAELIHEQQVSGTMVSEVLYAADLNKIALAEVEYLGANNIARANPNAVMIGLIPPSYDEWIRRFTSREEISREEFLNRLRTAKKVLQNFLDKPFYKIIINDDLDEATHRVRVLIEEGVFVEAEQIAGRKLVEDILLRLGSELSDA